MARKNIFPVILEGTQILNAPADWDGVSGRIILNGSADDLTLDSADYTDVPEGAVLLVHNKYSQQNQINFTTDLQGDGDSDVLKLEAGEMATLCYTSEFGWFVLGHTGSSQLANQANTSAIGGIE